MVLQLDMIPTSLMQRYNIEEIGRYQYRFVTEDNITYILSFIYIGNETSLPVYAFNIDRLSEKRSSKSNNKILNTVRYALELFFSNEENAILSTCDSDERSSAARHRLFRIWFEKLNDGSIVRKEQLIKNELFNTWALMYYKKNNIFSTLLEQYFNDYAELMNLIN